MSTTTGPSDPYGWDEEQRVGAVPPVVPPPTASTGGPAPAVVDAGPAADRRFTPERAEALLDADRRAERTLPWKQLLALLLVLAIVLLRATLLG